MQVNLSPSAAADRAWLEPPPSAPPDAKPGEDREAVREAFHSFVGQTLFGQLLKAMRKTVGKPAYFYGGRAEEIFQGQLDLVLAEKLGDASSRKLSDPMFELFMLGRK